MADAVVGRVVTEVASGDQTSNGDGFRSESSRSRSAARQVIMVVSAGTEATRPLVVTNLAATFADGGQRVLVMSTHDLHASNRVSPPGQDPMAPIAPEVLEALCGRPPWPTSRLSH